MKLSALEKIIEGLNPGQKQAVTHGRGPQLVVAGAGTGKTAVITKRIAHMVSSKLCSAKEILALTFTDKAAEEMENRVDLLVPYGFTDSTICTFHAFGDRVLREQGVFLGMNPNYKVLSTAEQLIFLREHIFDLRLDKLRPLSDPTRHLQMILRVISRAKDEDVTPETYLAYCDQLETHNSEDAEPADIAAWEKQKELAHVYACYQALLLKHGLADFGDLITLTLKLFREHPDVLADYQQRYRFIMVDEFQDTNAAQFALLRMLAGENGNITVVGDDDQSIYKFRGAAISNILQFTHYYPSADIKVLNENYRSTQTILDAAYRLIQHNNPERLEVKKQLNKRLRSQRTESVPVLYQGFETVSAEADWIAERLKSFKLSTDRGWSEFALLVRANRHADPYLRSMNMQGIPFRFSGNQGLYRQPEVRLCIAFLRLIANPADGLALHALASSEVYQMPIVDLAWLAAESRKKNEPMQRMLKQALRNRDAFLSDAGKAAGEKILDDLERYLEMSRTLPTGQILYRFLTESRLLANYTEAQTIAADRIIKNLSKFFNVVQKYEHVAQSDKVIHFVEHLTMLESVGDDPGTSEMDGEIDAVNVLTVHRAKGLEFPIVFLPGLAANRFPSINRSSALALPLELAKEELSGGDPFLGEERRLFYVAMTRAKEQLLMSSARDYGGARAYKVSRFVLESLEVVPDEQKLVTLSSLEKIKRHAPQQAPEIHSVGILGKDASLSLSFYQIDDFKTCPLKYKYIHLLKIPVLPHHAILYGKALHTAVSEFYRQRLRGKLLNEDDVIGLFKDTWVNEGFISREHEELRLNAGIAAIKLFMNNYTLNPVEPTYIEHSFSYFVGKNRIVGRMDRVDVSPSGEVSIIDFKSSEVFEQKEADKKARESLQLKMYAAAWLHMEKKLPEKVVLYFLDSGLTGVAKPDPDKILKTEELITEIAAQIRENCFDPKPSVWTCNYCPFRTVCPHAVS
ncbi:ATP-dependent helicase [bacterium]|nr:ATP-dependent helicase [bacterium]